MSFRSPYESLGQGIGEGLRNLAQTLIAERQRQAQAEELRQREEEQRQFQAQQNQLTRDFTAAQADTGFQRDLGLAFIEPLLAAGGQAGALDATGMGVPGLSGDISELVGQLTGALGSPFGETQNIPEILTGIAPQVPGLAGAAAGATDAAERARAIQDTNLETFENARRAILSENVLLNLGTAEGMQAFLVNAAMIRGLSQADMPTGVDVQPILDTIANVEAHISANPNLATLRQNQMAISNAGVVVSQQAASQAQLQTALLALDVPIKALALEEGQAALEGVQMGNVFEAYGFFEQTGLIPAGWEDRVRGMYERNTAGDRNAPKFEQFQAERFEAYKGRLEAQEDLLKYEVRIQGVNVKLSDIALDQAQYEQGRRDLVAFIESNGQVSTMLAGALQTGDTNLINRFIQALKNPNLDPQLSQWLREAGISAPYLESVLADVSEIDAFQTASMTHAKDMMNFEFHEANRNHRAAPIRTAVELQQALAAQMTPEQMQTYYETAMTPEQQVLFGGAAGLAAAQGRARLRGTVETNAVAKDALGFIDWMMDAPISESQRATVAEQLFNHLTEAGVSTSVAEAISVGFIANWDQLGRDEARAQANHDAQLALWDSQVQENLRIDPTSPVAGMDVSDVRQILDSQRSTLGEERNTLNEMLRAGGCMVPPDMFNTMPAPNAVPSGFNYNVASQAEWDDQVASMRMTPGQVRCANLQVELGTNLASAKNVNAQLASLISYSAAGGQTSGGPLSSNSVAFNAGAESGHPLSAYNIEDFSDAQQTMLFFAYDETVNAGELDPSDQAAMTEFLTAYDQWVMSQGDAFWAQVEAELYGGSSVAPAPAGAPAAPAPAAEPEGRAPSPLAPIATQAFADVATAASGNMPFTVTANPSGPGQAFGNLAARILNFGLPRVLGQQDMFDFSDRENYLPTWRDPDAPEGGR